MKKLYLLFALVIVFTASTAYAAGKSKLLETILLKADKIAVKGNTTLTGNIFNDSKTKGKDNPVTIKDNATITGTLTTKGLVVTGSSPFMSNAACAVGQVMKYSATGWACSSDTDTDSLAAAHCSTRDSIYWTGLSWGCINPINNYPDPNLALELKRTTTGRALSLNNHSDVQTYLELDTLPYNTAPTMACDPYSGTQGSMLADAYNNKLWVCMNSGWKSFTSD